MIVVFKWCKAAPGFMVSGARKRAAGIGRSKNTMAVKRPRRDVTRDLRDMYSYRSTDMRVIISNVMEMEYVAMTSPIVFMVIKRTGRPITTLGLLRYSKLVASTKGWAISHVHKSVSTSAFRRMWKGVL